MTDAKHKISHNRELLFVAFLVSGAVILQGCHDWPDERGAAIEAQNILRDIGRVNPVADPNIPRPSVYQNPPKKFKQIVGGAEEWKLVYFCRYHTAENMKQVIHEQFATQLFNQKGQSTTIQDYTVTANPATNQLIVRCPLESDIDAVLQIIEETDIPPIQVKIECLVSELYADLTVDRETSVQIENLFGEMAIGGEPTNDYLAFPGAALRDPARQKFGLKVGVDQGEPGHRIMALVDILVSRGYLKILMNPTLEVVNGQLAKIQSKQHLPLQQVTVQSGGFGGTPVLRTQTEYYDIIDQLEVTPHVYADGYIGLETQVQIAAHMTPEGISQMPIVTERTITNKDNRIRIGESLIIGGIRKSEKRDVIRGVPILKDIPGLNLLFSGRDFEERATEVIFILTPTISTGGKPNQDIVDMMEVRHSSPMTQALHETVMDPLGIKAREQEQERKVDAAYDAQMQSEAEKNAARLEAMETGQQIQDLSAELEQAKAQVEQASTKADQAVSAAEAARAQAEKATADAQQAKTEAEQAKAQAEQAGKSAAEPPQQQAAPQEQQPPAPPQGQEPAPPPQDAPQGPPQEAK